MKPAFDQLFLLGLFSAAIHWLVARAEITRPLWSRAHGSFDKLLRCAACSGFWIGGLLVLLASARPISNDEILWHNVIAGAISGLFLTPVFEATLLWGLRESAITPPLNDLADLPPAEPALTESGEVTPNERPR